MSHLRMQAGIRHAGRAATRSIKFGVRERETGTLEGLPNMGGHDDARTVWKDPGKVKYTWEGIQARRLEGDPLMLGGRLKAKPVSQTAWRP